MSQQQYSTGTMKVKNTAGEMIPFYPKTQINYVTDYDGNILSEKISDIEDNLSIIENSGSIEILYEEPSSENISNLSNESMIAWIDEPGFIFIINTYSLNSSNKKTSIPFDLYNVNNTTLTVDWGDGTTSTYTKSNYASSTALTSTSSTSLIHTYEVGGEYMVTVTSNNFSAVKIYANSSITTNSPIYFYKYTLRQICSPFPTLNTTTFECCFANCTSLTSIPAGLFDNNTAVTNFSHCFRYCSNLTSIPAGLFDNNTAVTDFIGCFSNCTSLTSIPAGLFDNNTAIINFGGSYVDYGCFYNCSSLTSIPQDLFKYNTNVTGFSACFSGCSSLTAIPEHLFDNNTVATSFLGCFNGCSSLTSIPEHLFDNNTVASSFNSCFEGCTSLTTIPTDLFRYNTAVVNFQYCFRACSLITTIPTDLFRYNTAVTAFSGCFRECTSITTIPTDLFRYNTAVTLFSQCFQSCSSLNDITIHIGSSLVTSVSSFVTKKTGVTRTVYVPTGSTTQTNFNSVASSLGLTIIGE